MPFTALLALAGCTDAAAERTALAEAAATERFGEDNRRSVDATPGVVSSVDETTNPTTLVIRGTGPYPAFGVDNGIVQVFSATLIVDNLATDATFVPTLAALPSDGRSDPNCDSTTYTDRGDIILAPLTPTEIAGTRVTFDIEIPACSRLEVQAQPPTTTEEIHIAVLAPLEGDRTYLANAAAAATERDADHVHVLGDALVNGEDAPYQTLIDTFDAAGVPVSVSLGGDDRHTRESSFINTLGPGDYMTEIGRTRFLNIDSSEHEISSPQLTQIEDAPNDGRPGVMVSHQSPVGLGTDRGWRSLAVVGRVLQSLHTRNFEWVIGGGGHGTAQRTFTGLSHISLHHEADTLALIRIARPWPLLDVCDADTPCSDGSCITGFCEATCSDTTECEGQCVQSPCGCFAGVCRPVCSADSDCPAPAAECDDGACALRPAITATLEPF